MPEFLCALLWFCEPAPIVSAELVAPPVKEWRLCIRDRDGDVVQLPWKLDEQSYTNNRSMMLALGITEEEMRCE